MAKVQDFVWPVKAETQDKTCPVEAGDRDGIHQDDKNHAYNLSVTIFQLEICSRVKRCVFRLNDFLRFARVSAAFAVQASNNALYDHEHKVCYRQYSSKESSQCYRCSDRAVPLSGEVSILASENNGPFRKRAFSKQLGVDKQQDDGCVDVRNNPQLGDCTA